MARVIVAVFALAILGMMGVAAFDAALDDVGEDTQIVNESFTPVGGDVTELSESNKNTVYYDTSEDIRVFNATDVKMSEPGDYEWIQSNGTIVTNSSGDLAGDPSANISYGYNDVTEEQDTLASLAALIPQLIGPLVLFMLILFMGAFIWR